MHQRSLGMKDSKHSISSVKVDSNFSSNPRQPHRAGLNDETPTKSTKESSETGHEGAGSGVLNYLKTVLQAKLKGSGPSQPVVSPEAKAETIDLKHKDSLSPPVEDSSETEPTCYRCTSCLRKFRSLSMLDIHRRVYHSDEGKSEGGCAEDLEVEVGVCCMSCRQEFVGVSQLTEHACLRLGNSVESADRVDVKSCVVSDSMHSSVDCDECGSVPVEERQQHQCAPMNCHSSNTKQASCDETLTEVEETTSLCMDHQGPFQTFPEQKGYCVSVGKHCEITSSSNNNMTDAEFSARSVGESVVETFQTSNMKRSAVGVAPCNQVASDFSSSTDISLICGPCGQHFPSAEDMKLHKCSRRCETEFPCSMCESKFKLFRSYRLHMKSIHQIESFQCSRCTRVFHSEEDLKAHPCQQNNRRPHLCDICGKSYKTAGYLATHKLSHFGIKPHKCVVCGKGFTQPSNLQTHLRIHRGERPFACKVCGKSFRQLDHLMKHAGVHTKDAPYACETCGKRFRDEDYVKKHMRIHTGAMPFECKDCGMKFRWANRFAAHKCKPDSGSDGVSTSGEDTYIVESAESQMSDSSLRAGYTTKDESSERGSRAELESEMTFSKVAAKSDSKVSAERKVMHRGRKKNPPVQTGLTKKGPAETDRVVGPVSKPQQLQVDKVDSEEQGDLSKTLKPSLALNGSFCNGPVSGRSIKNEQSDSDSDDDQGKLLIVEDDEEESRSQMVNGGDSDREVEVPDPSHNKSTVSCDVSSIPPHGKQSRLLAQMLLSKNTSVVARCPDDDIETDSNTTAEKVKDSFARGMTNSAGKTAASMHAREVSEVEGGGGDAQAEASTPSSLAGPAHAGASLSKSSSSAASCISFEPSLKREVESGIFDITGDAPSSGDKSLSLPLPLGDVCSMPDDQSFLDSLTFDLVKKYINLPPSPPRGSSGTGFVSALPTVGLPLPEGVAEEVPFPPVLPSSALPKDLPPPEDWSPVASLAAVPISSVEPVTSDSSQTTLIVASVTSLSVSEFERMPSSSSAPLLAPSPSYRDSKRTSVIQKGGSFEGPIPFSAQNSDVYTITNDGSNRLHQTVKTVMSLAGNAPLPPPQVPLPLPQVPHPSSLPDRQTDAPAFLANPSASHSTQNICPETIASSVAVPHPEMSSSLRPQNSLHIPLSHARISLIHQGIPFNRRNNPTAAVHQNKPAVIPKSEILKRLHPTPPLPSHSLSLPPRQLRSPPPYPGGPNRARVGETTPALRFSHEGRPAVGAVSARADRNVPPGTVASRPAVRLPPSWAPDHKESRSHSLPHSARPPMAHRPVAPGVGSGGPSSHAPAVPSSPAEQPMDLSVPRNRSEPENAAAERGGRDVTLLSPRSSREQREGNAGVEETSERSVAMTLALSTSSVSAGDSRARSGAIQNSLSSSDVIRKPSPAFGSASSLADSNLLLAESRRLPQTDATSLHVPDSPSTIAANPKAGESLTPIGPVSSSDDKQADFAAINKNPDANLIKRPGQSAMMQCVLCGCEFRWRPYKSTQKCVQCCRKTCASMGKSHICDICGKVFTQSGNLRTHLRLHAGDKPYECHICQKRFALMKYLNSHVRMHSDEKQFECHVCGKKLRDATYIKHHMRVHTGAKPFKCRSCGKAFRWRSEFRSHRCSPVSEKRGPGVDDCDQTTENDGMLTLRNGNLWPSGDGGCRDVRSEIVLGNQGKEMMFSKFRYRKPPLERKRNSRVFRESSKADMVNPETISSRTVTGPEVSVDKVLPINNGKDLAFDTQGECDPPNPDDLTLEATDATKGKQMAFGLVRIVDEQKGLAEVVWTSSSGGAFAHGSRSGPDPDGNLQDGVVETSTPQMGCTARALDLPTDVLLLQNDYIYGGQEEEPNDEDEIKTEPMEESENQGATALPEDATSHVYPNDEKCQNEIPSAKDDISCGDAAQKDRSDDGYDTFDERRQSDSDERANLALPACPEESCTGTLGTAASVLPEALPPPPAYGLDLLSRVCARGEKPNDPVTQTVPRPRVSKMPVSECSDDASGCDLAPLNVMVSNILAIRPDIPASSYTTKPSALAPRLASKLPPKASTAVGQPQQPAPQDPSEGGVVWMPMSSLQFPPGTLFVNSSKPCTSVANSQGKLPQTTVLGGRPISHVVSPTEQVLPCHVASSAEHVTPSYVISPSEHVPPSGPEVPRKVVEKSTEKAPEAVCQDAPLTQDVGKRLWLKLKRKSSDHDSNAKWEVEVKGLKRKEEDARTHLSADRKHGTGDTAVVSADEKDTRASAMSGASECDLQGTAAPPMPVSAHEMLAEDKDSGDVPEGAENEVLPSAKRSRKRTGSGAPSRKRRRKSRFRIYRSKRSDIIKANKKHGRSGKKHRRAEGELLVAATKEILSVMQKETRRTEEAPSRRVVVKRGRGSLVCNECGKRFMQASRLAAHKRDHDAADNRRCPECHKVFSKAGNLAQHMLIHADFRPFACNVCGRRFRQRHHLSSHLRAHADLKNHECQYCHKKLRDRWYLKQHLRLHSSVNPFRCPDCGKAFRWKALREKHKCTGINESVESDVADSESKDSLCPDGSATQVSEEPEAQFRSQEKSSHSQVVAHVPSWRKKRKKSVKPTEDALEVGQGQKSTETSKGETSQSQLTKKRDTVGSACTAQSSGEVSTLGNETLTHSQVVADVPSSRKRRKKSVKPTEDALDVGEGQKSTETSKDETYQSKLTKKRDTVGSACTDQFSGEVTTRGNETSTRNSSAITSPSSHSVPAPAVAEEPMVTQISDTNCQTEMVQPPVTEQSDLSVITSSGSEKKADVEDQLSHGETVPSTSAGVAPFVLSNLAVATSQSLHPPPSASSQAQTASIAVSAQALPIPKGRPSQRRPRVRKQAEGRRQGLPLGGPPPLIEAETLYRAQALSKMSQPMDLSFGAPRAAIQGQDGRVEGVGAASRIGEVSALPPRPHDYIAEVAGSTDSVRHLAGRCSPETRMINLADFPVGRLKQQGRWQREHIPDGGLGTVPSFSSAANMAAMPTHTGVVLSLSQFESDPSITVKSKNIPRRAPHGHGLSAEAIDPALSLMSPAAVSSSSQPHLQSEGLSKRLHFLNPTVSLAGRPVFIAANTERPSVATAGPSEGPAVLISSSSASFMPPGAPSALPQWRSSGSADCAVAVSHPVAFQAAIPSNRVSLHQPQQPFPVIPATTVNASAVVPAHTSNPPARLESVGQQSVVFMGIPTTTGSADAQNNIPQPRLNNWQGTAQAHLHPGPVSSVCSPHVEAGLRSAAREVSDLGPHGHPKPNVAAPYDAVVSVASFAVQGREGSASPGNSGSMSTPRSDDDDATCTSSCSTTSGHAGKGQSPTVGDSAQRVACVKCSKTFPSKLALRRHMRAHTTPAPYRCPNCDKGFHDPETLRAHQPGCSGFNPRKCPTCGKVFSQTGNCKKHMLIHEDARPYECELCHKRFRALYHLQCHMTTHNDERPYSCELCGKTFRDGSYIKKHMRLHTGELPYKCEYCSESFRWSSVYTKHLSRVHGLSGVKGSDEQTSPTAPQN